LVVLVNFESPSVFAARNKENESSETVESDPLKENYESEETKNPVLENKMVVSDQVVVEPKLARAGEQRSFRLTLPEELKFETIVLSYLDRDTKTELTVELTYDAAKKQYVGQLETTNETTSGHYLLTKIVGI